MLSGPVVETVRASLTMVARARLTLHGVANKEDRPVETDQIEVPILGVKLGSESSRVSAYIWKFPTILATPSGISLTALELRWVTQAVACLR